MRYVVAILIGIGILLFIFRGLGARANPESLAAREPIIQPAGLREQVLSLTSFTTKRGTPLYAGTRKGFYHSLDGGFTWQRLFSSGIWGAPVESIAPYPGKPDILMIAAGNGLFISWDGGRRWRRLLLSQGPIHCVAVDPNKRERLFIGTEQGIQVSQDLGKSWSGSNGGIPQGPVRGVVFDPLRAGRLYALGDAGLFRSDDEGATWSRIQVSFRAEPDSSVAQITVATGEENEEFNFVGAGGLVVDPDTGAIYLGTEKGILLSRDAGMNWTGLPSVGLGNPRVNQLLLDTARPRSLYAATEAGLFLYTENRRAWVPVREGLPSGPVHAAALAADGEHLWVGSDRGLFRVPVPVPAPQFPAAGSQRLPSSLPGQGTGSRGMPAEPSIREVQAQAIRYAEVMPEKIAGWRRGAVWRNWIPKFTLSMNRDLDTTVASATSNGKTTFSIGPQDESLSVTYGFTWDLANLVWNPDQTSIDVRSRLMVQLRQDVLDEVTRVYFERKRLLLEFQGNPTDDAVLRNERGLRIQELTAQLDGLTGGWFSNSGQEFFDGH